MLLETGADFEIVEVTETPSYLILISLSKIRTGGSFIVQYYKHTNRWFFENSNDRTTLVYSGNLDWARF